MFRPARRLLALVPWFALPFVPGCGVSGGDRDPISALTIALGDAPSDDVSSFIVTVTGVTLTYDSDKQISVLSTPVTVDLATLSTFSQILDVSEIFSGHLKAAALTIDFTDASCHLVGQTTPAALLDANGLPLTGTVMLPLDLSRASPHLRPNNHHVLEFDFAFDQSLAVDTVGNSVVVTPAIVVRFDRHDARELVAFGGIGAIYPTIGLAVLDLQTLSRVSIKRIFLSLDSNTVYQIDGVPYSGAAGLAVLDALPFNSWVQVYGVASPGRQRIDVSYLEAGTGTWNGGQDLVEGYVIDRAGIAGADASFTVLGFSSNAAHTISRFNTTFTVDASIAATNVVRRGNSTVYSTDAVNVGQRIRAFGSLTGVTLDAATSSAVVRELVTPIGGLAVGAPSGSTLTLDLARIGPHDPSLFSWANSGTTPPDPGNFTIDIGSLGSGLTIGAGTPLIAWGFVSAVDDATVDSSALLLTDLSDGPVVVVLRDRLAGFEVVTSATGGQIQFTITGTQGADEEASLEAAFVGPQALATTPDPKIVAGSTQTIYVLYHATTAASEYFALFDDFVTALDDALTGGETLSDAVAVGSFDDVTNTVGASFVTAVVK